MGSLPLLGAGPSARPGAPPADPPAMPAPITPLQPMEWPRVTLEKVIEEHMAEPFMPTPEPSPPEPRRPKILDKLRQFLNGNSLRRRNGEQ